MQRSQIGNTTPQDKPGIHHDEITDLIKGTIPFTTKTLVRISDLLKEYPYFQAAHLLYSLNLLQLKDNHFQSELPKTAIYVPDRKQLFLRVENKFIAPALLETMEKETPVLDSSFQLIDVFLSGRAEKPALKNIEQEQAQVSTDYVAYFLSQNPEAKETPPLHYQEAIDRFLEKDAISPVKITLNRPVESEEEPEQPAPISEQSPEGVGFFTETLAKIYIKQKKYNKALEIIRKLNLIYPEKSRYFAEQILFLERLIKYTNKTN